MRITNAEIATLLRSGKFIFIYWLNFCCDVVQFLSLKETRRIDPLYVFCTLFLLGSKYVCYFLVFKGFVKLSYLRFAFDDKENDYHYYRECACNYEKEFIRTKYSGYDKNKS